MSIQLNKNDNDAMKADNEAMKARMDGIQEKPVRLSQFLKPAEPATVTKDGVNESDPLSENVESSEPKMILLVRRAVAARAIDTSVISIVVQLQSVRSCWPRRLMIW